MLYSLIISMMLAKVALTMINVMNMMLAKVALTIINVMILSALKHFS